ncbi:MAG: hypothetical protein AAGK04_12170 [Planctomycetota bacterium]
MTVTALVASALLMGATGQTGYQANEARPIATPAPYPYNIVDSTSRPGFNGRLWVDRAIVGGAERVWPIGWGDPGPAHFGAAEYTNPIVYVRRDAVVIGVSAWERFDADQAYPVKEAQRFWLQEQNYTGGVRTHIAPAVRQGVVESARPYVIEPRARFRAPADAPKLRQRMQVRVPGRDLEGARVFLPHTAPASMRARLASSTAVARAD